MTSAEIDFSLSGIGGGGNDEIVGAATPSLAADSNQQFGVRAGDRRVVVDDRNGGADVVDEPLTSGPMSPVSKPNPGQQLGEGDGRDRDLVVVADEVIELEA